MFPVIFWVELKVAKKPLLPFHALSAEVSFVLVCEACGWADFGMLAYYSAYSRHTLTCIGSFIYYFIQILQQLRGTSPLLTMAEVCPVAISGFFAAITTGHVISRSYRLDTCRHNAT